MKSIAIACSLALALASVSIAEAKVKKNHRSDYTAAQQRKIFEAGMKSCRKKYGAQVARVEVDYIHMSYTCYGQ